MGMVECKKHGLTGIYPSIDLKLATNIYINEEPLDKEIIVLITDIRDDELEVGADGFVFPFFYYYYASTFYENNLERRYLTYTDEEDINVRKILPKTSPVCGKCFDEYVSKHSLKILR